MNDINNNRKEIETNNFIKSNNRDILPNSDQSLFSGRFANSDNQDNIVSKMTIDGQTLLKEQWLNSLKTKKASLSDMNVSDIGKNEATDENISLRLEKSFKDTIDSQLQQLKKAVINEQQIKNPAKPIPVAPILKPIKLDGSNKQSTLVDVNGKPINSESKIITELPSDINLKANPTTEELSNAIGAASDDIKKAIAINSKKELDSKTMTLELIKCRMSALYFIENYVSVPVAGGRVSMRESEQWNSTDKYKIIIELFQQHDSVLYMSSRQSGKTTTSAMYLLWCMVFFPKIQISYLTLDKNRAIDMISRMKEMMDSLPKWLRVRPKSNAERLSYYELSNGSKISASFVSGSNDPDKVGRGLSSPIVFIDETAFIPHADIVWGALQPSVSAAKRFAKRNGYPNGVIFTSTPNGAGENFFYNVYNNSVKFDDIYNYETKTLYPDYLNEFSKEGKNAFISVVLHWSEFRTQEWYEEQKKELNFNQKKINQELDLAFLGSNACIFSDEVIAQLIPKRRVEFIKLPYGNEFDLFEEIDPNEKYFLGVDTAMSAGAASDFSAIVLTRARDGKPIGEWKGRFSVVKRFAQLVKTVIKSLKILHGLNSSTLIVVIERNSIGKETLEELIYDESEFDFEIYLFKEQVGTGNNKEWVPGLYTSNSGKMGQGKRDKMFNMLMTYANENPYSIHGRRLIDELRNLEQKTNGRIEAGRGHHDDVIMAWNFCLYARRYLIETGQLFIQGESKMNRAAVEADLLGMVLQSGNSSLNETTDNIIHVDASKLNKMAGVSKVELKARENIKQQIQKDQEQLTNLREVFKDIYVQQEYDPDQQENDFDPTDYFII